MQDRHTTHEPSAGSGVTAIEAQLEKELMAASSMLEKERGAREAIELRARRAEAKLEALAHDLRSPLNAILGWVQLLARKCSGNAEIESMLARIEASARAQAKMLSDLQATPPRKESHRAGASGFT